MFLLHLIYFAILGVILIILGILILILIPIFPIYKLCMASGEPGKKIGLSFLGLCLLSLVLIIAGASSVMLSPLIAICVFFYVYYLIFTEGISPYYSLQSNWGEMSKLINKSSEYKIKYYNAHKHKFNQ